MVERAWLLEGAVEASDKIGSDRTWSAIMYGDLTGGPSQIVSEVCLVSIDNSMLHRQNAVEFHCISAVEYLLVPMSTIETDDVIAAQQSAYLSHFKCGTLYYSCGD
jgi:hypothetical protein